MPHVAEYKGKDPELSRSVASKREQGQVADGAKQPESWHELAGAAGAKQPMRVYELAKAALSLS